MHIDNNNELLKMLIELVDMLSVDKLVEMLIVDLLTLVVVNLHKLKVEVVKLDRAKSLRNHN